MSPSFASPSPLSRDHLLGRPPSPPTLEPTAASLDRGAPIQNCVWTHMNINDLRGTLAQLCQIAALALAIGALLKLFGLVTIRPGVIEMSAVAIALSLLK